jgi:hypothetical protein
VLRCFLCVRARSCVRAEPCEQLCVAWGKRCPGSSADLAAVPKDLFLPRVECSGHGTCLRDRDGQCREGDDCAAVCMCESGYGDSDCALDDAKLAAAQRLRGSLLTTMVRCVG